MVVVRWVEAAAKQENAVGAVAAESGGLDVGCRVEDGVGRSGDVERS